MCFVLAAQQAQVCLSLYSGHLRSGNWRVKTRPTRGADSCVGRVLTRQPTPLSIPSPGDRQASNITLQQVTPPSAFSVSDMSSARTSMPARRSNSAVRGNDVE